MAELEQLTIETGGMSFSALAAGPEAGRLVLFLHGWPQGAGQWEAQLQAVAAAGCRGVAFDQRGYSDGARPTDVGAYAMQHLVADVLAVADDLGGHTFDLVGHDWGSAVAWTTASNYPQRVRTLTAVSVPHPRALLGHMAGEQGRMSAYMAFFQQPERPEEILLSDDAELVRAMFTGSSDPRVQEKAATVGFSSVATRTGLSDEVARRWATSISRPGVMTAALGWYRAMGTGTMFAGDVEVPTLFVWSTGDFALGRAAAEDTQQFVKADYRFEVLDGISHWIPEEAPDDLNRLLLDHLATHG